MILVQLGVPAQDAFVRLLVAVRRPWREVARDMAARRPVLTADID